jgi:hypothetical protein
MWTNHQQKTQSCKRNVTATQHLPGFFVRLKSSSTTQPAVSLNIYPYIWNIDHDSGRRCSPRGYIFHLIFSQGSNVRIRLPELRTSLWPIKPDKLHSTTTRSPWQTQ